VPAAVVGVTVGADVGEPGPVVEPWSFRSVAGAAAGPRGGGQVFGQMVGAAAGLTGVETWAFSILPAVPVYCRCTPTVAVPYFRSPVSSTATIPPGSPNASRT
jgi:hypothetical protein